MSKTDYRCDKCGTPLYLDAGGKSATCPACGSKEVYVHDFRENDDKIFPVKKTREINDFIAKGEAYLEMQEYSSAFESFANAINIDPNDYRGWWGTCRCRLLDNYLGEDNGYSRDFKKVVMLAPDHMTRELETKYETYLARLEEKRDVKEKEFEKSKKLAQGEIINIQAHYGPRKTFWLDIFLIVLLLVLSPFAVVLALKVDAYSMAGFILAAMFVLGSVVLMLELFRKIKIIKAIEKDGCKTVTELMTIAKRKKKPEFLKALKDLISSGYIIGYEILESENISKVADYENIKTKKDKTRK